MGSLNKEEKWAIQLKKNYNDLGEIALYMEDVDSLKNMFVVVFVTLYIFRSIVVHSRIKDVVLLLI